MVNFGSLFFLLIFTFISTLVLAETGQNSIKITTPINISQKNTKQLPQSDDSANWITIQDGLQLREFASKDKALQSLPKITVVRIDPEKFDFILKSVGETGDSPLSLEQWANKYNLVAAINASMYLPDNKTSTGYMRNGEYINNNRIAERFGAFLAANPKKEGLPFARIIDKDEDNWKEQLENYNLVIQNYRMTNARRKILWSPGGPLYAISAIAEDGDGNILFLHSSTPQEAYNFVQQVLHLPLDVRTIMYVEGGAQAGMIIQTENIHRNLGLPHALSFFATGNLKATLPNVIGIQPKSR